ncbi:MAG: succinylglutamate desuccinylase/aspartoacylase family protein [Candidatus Paceibacteria bacterium]
MNKKQKSIFIDKVGALEINIPVLQFGSGQPKVLLLNGIHGDEISGLFVIKRLISNINLSQGQLDIITSANPLAQALQERKTPLDKKDLNRSFDPKDSTLTEQIAEKLLERLKKYDLIIDMHTFENCSPIVCIFINHGTEKVKKKSKQQIENFAPELVWELDIDSKADKDFLGSLGPRLSHDGTPNFVIEMPEHFRVTDQQIKQVSQGIENVLYDLGMSTDKPEKSKKENLPYFERKRIKAKNSGIFDPKRNLMTKIEPGDKIGEITQVDSFNTEPVIAQEPGKLIIINDRDMVMPGDLLFSLGKKVDR